MRKLAVLVALVFILLAAYPFYLAVQVWEQSRRDEVHSADAIVVLGAAQYNGLPSPIFRARLDHAAYLYREGLAPRVIVTGGKRPGDSFTEGEAGAAYLIIEGVPSGAIIIENEGRSTLDSLRKIHTLTEGSGIESLLLVSDPMHSERIERIAEDLGYDEVYTSPASYVHLNRSRATKARELVREVLSIMAYQFFDS